MNTAADFLEAQRLMGTLGSVVRDFGIARHLPHTAFPGPSRSRLDQELSDPLTAHAGVDEPALDVGNRSRRRPLDVFVPKRDLSEPDHPRTRMVSQERSAPGHQGLSDFGFVNLFRAIRPQGPAQPEPGFSVLGPCPAHVDAVHFPLQFGGSRGRAGGTGKPIVSRR